MNPFLRLIAFISVLLTGFVAYSQPATIVPPSPNAASLGKFGEIPVNYSTGSLNLNIPLYTLKEGDIQVPIQLFYNYSGYRPYESHGTVGRGWSLQAGGVITRTVQGLPDEHNTWGYMVKATEIKQAVDAYMANNTATFAIGEVFNRLKEGNYDAQPDWFHFSFGGNSGKFFLGEDGTFHLVSNQKIKIDYTTTSDPSHSNARIIDKFVLTTEDGALYTFDKKEWSKSETSFYSETSATSVSAWYLSQIVSPTGRSVTLNYTAGDGSNPRVQNNIFERSVASNNGSNGQSSTYTGPSFSYGISEEIFLTSIESELATITFTHSPRQVRNLGEGKNSNFKYLQKIEVKTKAAELVTGFDFSYVFNSPDVDLILKTVQEKGSDGSVKPPYQFDYILGPSLFSTMAIDMWGYFNLAYNNVSLLNERGRFPNFTGGSFWALNSVTYPTGGKSMFEYEGNDFSYVSQALYTGKLIETKEYIYTWQSGDMVRGQNETFSVPEASRCTITYTCGSSISGQPIDPNSPCSAINGRVIEPTLQPNRTFSANTFLDPSEFNTFISASQVNQLKSAVNSFFSVRITVDVTRTVNKGNAGGIRLKKMITMDGIGANGNTVKEYFYTDPANSQLSTGSVQYVPVTTLVINSNDVLNGSPQSTTAIKSEPIFPLSTHNGSPVLYNTVTEVTNGTAKTVYTFSSFKDFPDMSGYSFFNVNSSSSFQLGPTETFEFGRGLLTNTKQFAQSVTTPVRQEVNSYPLKTESAVTEAYRTPALYFETLYKRPPGGSENGVNLYVFKIYYIRSAWYYKKQESVTTTSLTGQNPIQVTTNYEYSNPNHMQLTRKTVARSDGQTEEALFKYALDYKDTPTKAAFVSRMIENHIVNPVLEKQTWLVNGGTRKLFDAKLTLFREQIVSFPSSSSTTVVPDKEFILNTDSPITTFTTFNGSSYDTGNYRQTVTYDQYDDRGNLLQMTPVSGVPVVYLWAYKKSLPVAEVKNATVSEVTSAMGTTTSALGDLTSETDIRTRLSQLRSGLSKAMVSSFTHKLLRGMSTSTTPAGDTTFYEYDGLGRLIAVRDRNNKLLKSYAYKYKQ